MNSRRPISRCEVFWHVPVLGNKNEKIPHSTLKELAHEHGIIDPLAIIEQVAEAVRQWGDFAKAAGIPKSIADRYGRRMKDIHPDRHHPLNPIHENPVGSAGFS